MRTESLKRGVMALAIGSAMMLGGCASMAATKNPIGGSAAGSASADANKTLEHCAKPLGTLAVEEDTSQNWFAILTTQYHLPATTPLIRLMIQQSNCFVVVDRGRAMSSMMQERGLADSGELRGRSNMGKGQMVAADYVVTPTIQFAEDTGGGSGALAAVGGNYGALLGAIAGSIKHREASTTLMLTDVRSGVQVAVAQGSASKNDFGFGALGLGSSAGAGVGGYSKTPQGRLIAAAFLDSYNEMVRAVRNYAPQRVAGGLGTGGPWPWMARPARRRKASPWPTPSAVWPAWVCTRARSMACPDRAPPGRSAASSRFVAWPSPASWTTLPSMP
jgi:curli biogenesis system outer membrane secretion channel CsgG